MKAAHLRKYEVGRFLFQSPSSASKYLVNAATSPSSSARSHPENIRLSFCENATR